jgi:dUTP pyrophosphatase
MEVKFKKLIPEAVTPTYGKPGDAGLDLTAISIDYGSDENGTTLYTEYNTYIAVEIPEGHVGLLFPRSSISKTQLALANSVGVVDSNYRGPIKLRFKRTSNTVGSLYRPGERVGQLIIMPIPTVELEEVEDLSETSRGEGGFGSSGA